MQYCGNNENDEQHLPMSLIRDEDCCCHINGIFTILSCLFLSFSPSSYFGVALLQPLYYALSAFRCFALAALRSLGLCGTRV